MARDDGGAARTDEEVAREIAHAVDYNADERAVEIAHAIAQARIAERERCVGVCNAWLAEFEGAPIEHVPANTFACDAVKDIIDDMRAARKETPDGK